MEKFKRSIQNHKIKNNNNNNNKKKMYCGKKEIKAMNH